MHNVQCHDVNIVLSQQFLTCHQEVIIYKMLISTKAPVLVLVTGVCEAEIIKPYGEWLCNYCALGNCEFFKILNILIFCSYSRS